MHIHKLIAMNALTNSLVYELDSEIISVRNQLVYYVSINSDNQFVAVGRDNRYELNSFDASVKSLLLKSGFIQISDTLLVNSNYIHQILIKEQKIELNNSLLLPYSEKYKHGIDQFLKSIAIDRSINR